MNLHRLNRLQARLQAGLRAAALWVVLLAAAPWAWAQGLVFAVNEGVSCRVSDDEIRARYAGIATDLRGRKLGAPDEDSITAWMVRATMRDVLGDPKAAPIKAPFDTTELLALGTWLGL